MRQQKDCLAFYEPTSRSVPGTQIIDRSATSLRQYDFGGGSFCRIGLDDQHIAAAQHDVLELALVGFGHLAARLVVSADEVAAHGTGFVTLIRERHAIECQARAQYGLSGRFSVGVVNRDTDDGRHGALLIW